AVYRYRHRKRLGMIRVAAQNPQMAELPLPEAESDTEEEYRRLVMALRADLTRRREEYESALREMRDDYTLWAHQIKTPIAALRLQLGEERQEEMIELQRIEDYVEMALTVQRLNGGDLMPQECDLDAVIKKSVRKHARMFIRKRLYLRYEPSGARAVTDEKWLAFILEQVLVNAIKYTEIGGITIAWKEDTLTVADTGIGIAAEDLPRVFERGYTGMNGRIDGRATGMGLYLCRRAARMLGHGLKIESEAGKGTRVSICFARPKLAVD
ncbi:MAG: sensor histidine kinase, partial [Clostridia bacterium]|nr:sensor histidine kinase [Clostridia bacterium]